MRPGQGFPGTVAHRLPELSQQIPVLELQSYRALGKGGRVDFHHRQCLVVVMQTQMALNQTGHRVEPAFVANLIGLDFLISREKERQCLTVVTLFERLHRGLKIGFPENHGRGFSTELDGPA